MFGGLAQLARAPALHAGGQRFESVILHSEVIINFWLVIIFERSLTWCNQKSKVKAESIYRPYVIGKKKSKQGHMADALALGGDEGRDKLR